jgi:hypothetical protein
MLAPHGKYFSARGGSLDKGCLVGYFAYITKAIFTINIKGKLCN